MGENLIDVIEYARDSRLLTLQKMKRSKLPIYLYGAGKAAKLRLRWLKEYNIQISGCCVDSEYYMPGMKFEGMSVYSLDDLENQQYEYQLFIGFENHSKAKDSISHFKKKGITVYYIEDPFKFRYMDYDYFIKNSDSFQEAYNLLEDELSRKIFVAFLKSKISGCSDEISQYQSKAMYSYDFDLLNLTENEIFVDCGAFDGDTIKEFIQYTNGKYDKIYAFEPDEKNVSALKDMVSSDNIMVIEKGIGRDVGKAGFYEDASMYSNFVDTSMWGENTRRDLYEDKKYIEVPITSLDKELKDVSVSTIKMDIEGSELDALIGAKNLIRMHYPKLAICVYHKPEDMYAIINYIHSLESDDTHYKYYLRQHSDDITETVLYAIPEQKL